MALNKEIWLSTVQENLFPDNSFATKSVNDNEFVEYKEVHIPNAGAASGVKRNRKKVPAEVEQRTDNDLIYSLDELTTDPIYIPNIDKVELSYNKRESILRNDREKLKQEAHESLLYGWMTEDVICETDGGICRPHTSLKASGNRKKITKDTISSLSVRFNVDNIPDEGRYILLDSVMYMHLLKDLTGVELSAFSASADAQRGILGKLYGFNIIQRSRVLRMTAGKKLLKWDEEAAADELAAGLAWQEDCVSRALGEIKMFDSMDNPLYYGDIYSFLMRVGGSYRRWDKKGIATIVEAAADA